MTTTSITIVTLAILIVWIVTLLVRHLLEWRRLRNFLARLPLGVSPLDQLVRDICHARSQHLADNVINHNALLRRDNRHDTPT